MQRFETNITFNCPHCSNISRIDVEVPELDFSSDKTSEQTSDGEIQFTCPECDADFYGYAFCNPGMCSLTVEYENDKFELDGEPPMYSPPDDDDWIDYAIPENPYGIFGTTHDQVLALVDLDIETPDDPQIIERMVFAQLISAMEAYLSDTLISKTLSDVGKMKSLLAKDTEINKEKFSLEQIVNDNELVEKSVKSYLRKILYHNLGKVQFLYNAALSIEIKTNDEDWEDLHKAIANRHDCTHRNGFDSEGNKNEVFTPRYIKQTAEVVKRMIDGIHDALSEF